MVLCLEAFEAQIAGLVEMFLMEVYRCKLCQFTSSIKNKIRTGTACQISGCPKMDQDENESYSMGDEGNQENKDNKENLSKMSVSYLCIRCFKISVLAVVT